MLEKNPLPPGAAIVAWLTKKGEPENGVLVPREAVVRFNGLAWAYVKTGDGTFTRREVESEQLVEGGWFTTHNFKAGDEVVTTGAQQLLSEELKTAE
ncbi:MAG: hypothetical protein HY301_21490 [Verrucomicrobia bacterium]|nr:hypothetical protein [Verrucomicrobiota bacterium]